MVTKIVVRDVETLKKALSNFKSNKPHSFDTETTSAEIRKFRQNNGLSKPLPPSIDLQALNYYYLEMEGMSLYDGETAIYIDFENNEGLLEQCLPTIKNLFETSTGSLVGHNIAFDIKVLKKYNINIENRKIYCTMVADHLLDEEREHGLKKLAKEILGQEETIKYIDARRAGDEVFAEYALNDAIWTYDLCMWQQPKMKEEGVVDVFRNIEMPFQFCLVEMESTGMYIDTKKVAELKEQLNEFKNQYLETMLDILGHKPLYQATFDSGVIVSSPINLDSNNVLADILFNKFNLPVIDTTPKGSPAVGKNTISALKNKHPFVSTLHKYKIVNKLLLAYFNDDAQIMRNLCPDNRVRPFFRDTGTKTGRQSCSEPNLQQLPKMNEDLPIPSRSAFVAPTGYSLVVADFSGQEIRVMAEISKDPTLVEALNNGYDMHLAIANQFYKLGIPKECLMETHQDYDTWKKKFKNERTKAKTITFGLAYGKGAYGFSQDFNITEDEAQKIVDDYFDGMPKLREAIDNSKKEVEKTGCVVYLSGRKRHFKKIQNGDWEGYSKKSLRQAFNAMIQGFSADMVRMSCNNVFREKQKHPEWDLKIIATIHDELIVEVKEEYATEASKLIKECMESSVNFCVPTPAEVDIGKNYNEAK